MAKFNLELPTDVMKDFRRIYDDSDKIFGAMTTAGAEVAASKIKATVPVRDMASHVKITRVYKTPTDDGINTKVYLSGYLPFKGNRTTFVRRGREGSAVYSTSKGIPVDFLGMVFEYGRSYPSFPKKPFLRKAFSKKAIETAKEMTDEKVAQTYINNLIKYM